MAGGSNPANIPTQAHPNIWYGSHGPTPPVIRAEANMVVQPRAKPKPGPNTRPASTRVNSTVSIPAVPAPSGRRAAPRAERTPSMAMALASMPPSATWANTTASTRTSSDPNSRGAMAPSPKEPGAMTKGQRKATNPRNEARATVTRDRAPTRMATPARAISRSSRGRPPPGRG